MILDFDLGFGFFGCVLGIWYFGNLGFCGLFGLLLLDLTGAVFVCLTWFGGLGFLVASTRVFFGFGNWFRFRLFLWVFWFVVYYCFATFGCL